MKKIDRKNRDLLKALIKHYRISKELHKTTLEIGSESGIHRLLDLDHVVEKSRDVGVNSLKVICLESWKARKNSID